MVFLLAWASQGVAAIGGASVPANRSDGELERAFAETVHPFVETYCFACHGEKQKGKLDLRPYSTREAIAKDYRRWDRVLEKLKAGNLKSLIG